jgi:nucleoside-diphosphate kinase
MATQRTLVLVKPDGVRRGLAGEVIGRLERKGLSLVAMELRNLDVETAQAHYAEHAERPFFGELVEFITGGPLVALVVEGPNAVAGTRRLMGVTNPVEATPGSIRGDYALEIGQNLVHGSDSPESAEREIGIFFPSL